MKEIDWTEDWIEEEYCNCIHSWYVYSLSYVCTSIDIPTVYNIRNYKCSHCGTTKTERTKIN